MTQPNLLDIVPEELFQTHFIADVDQVQKKLQYEIERKREELRAMVGEKYRDLIQAADTIEEMKETTTSTLTHIGEMITACRSLHNTHLVGFKIEKPPSSHSIQMNNNSFHCISVQIKILMEIPEKIWSSIEAEDYVRATQLFIMARHINTGLQLQISGRNAKAEYQPLQRIIQQQWNSMSNFNQTIIDLCKVKLQDVNISVEVACSCLISLYLLDSQTMSELLDTLIALTSYSSLKSTLNFDLTQILDVDIKARIKEKIVNGVRIVLKTVLLVYSCFVENNGGVVFSMLNDLYRKDSQPLIDLVRFSNPNALKILPPVIVNYRLTTNKELQRPAKEDITACVQKWSEWVKTFIDKNVRKLLQNVTRAKLLHEIRDEAFKVETPANWSTICTSLDIPETHVWCQYFQPLLTDRVKLVIDNRWERVYDLFKTQMLVDLTRVSSENEVEKEADINWFVWKDLIGDTVIESRSEVVKVMNSLLRGMWLQDRGFTNTLANFCQSLDTELQKLLEDLKIYLYKDTSRSGKDKLLYSYEEDDDLEEIYKDKSVVLDYLKDVSDRSVHSMLQYIKACFDESTLQSELQKRTTAVYTARFTQAITHLMPHLQKCYITIDTNSYSTTIDDDSLKRWNSIRAVLKETCLYCWGKWVDNAMARVVDLTVDLPQEFTLAANFDYLMMQWDTIKLEEKDDEGKPIETSIKIPSCPSLKLQEFIYSASRILDEVVPHTLPSETHTNYVERLAEITFAHYNKVIREKETEINQRCALQLLMDVRHMTLLLIPRENKKYIDLSHELCEFIRQMIDPFDYDVFYPHIQTNVKRSVQRVQTLFGSLVLRHGELSSVVAGRYSHSQNPSLLATCDSDTQQWFSMLPIAALPARTSDVPKKKPQAVASPNKSKTDISELMTSSLPINFATARSGAASFFSMTSDWFSGN